ncbi:MAG: P-loop NTPase [Pseudomonadota bacterium]
MATLFKQFQSTRPAAVEEIRAKHLAFRSQSVSLHPGEAIPARSQVICVASGKGGVGKTLVSCNLSVALAQKGLRVTLVDADFGFANAHLVLGIEPRHDISSVVRREMSVDEIAERGPAGIRFIPGGSGKTELALISDADFAHLAGELCRLEESSDVTVIDLGAGIGNQVLRFLNAAHDIVLVSDHEATSQSDALSTIAMLAETLGAATIHIVINRARDREHAVVAFQKIWQKTNAAWRGRIKLFFSGWLPNNWYVQSSVMLGKPLVLRHPHSLPARCIQTMGDKFHKHNVVWMSRQVGRFGVPSAFARLQQMSRS